MPLPNKKDWTGNKQSSHSVIGARNYAHQERQGEDYYATNPEAILDLIKVETFKNKIWENACGEGHLSKKLIENGFDVYSTDIVDRGFGEGGVDFLNNTDKWEGDIITNPPYKYGKEWVEKSMECLNEGAKLAMFLKLQFLEGKARKLLFEKYPPKTIYVYSGRQFCALNGDFEKYKKMNAVSYCWYVWEKGFTGNTIIKWI